VILTLAMVGDQAIWSGAFPFGCAILTAPRWRRGDTIVHHEVWADRVWAARPLIVVDDTEQGLALWLPAGTRRKVPAPPVDATGPERDPEGLSTEASHRGVIENLQRGDWAYTDHVWDVSSLWLLRPGAWYAIWVSWLPSGEHLGWYVNFQTPYRRTSLGIEAMDLMLDLVVETDRSWHWKDQHEFDQMERLKLVDGDSIGHIRREAVMVLANIEEGTAPFCDPWPQWTPEPHWPIPALPSEWSSVPS
jgi:protein associated with RNAse G/E